jgi:hypothetical protein
MFAIDNDTASTTLPPIKPVGIPGFFTAGTVGGVPATIVEADFLNQVQQELLAVLAAASIAPSKATNNQVIQAILWLIANNTRQRLTGPLNLYVNAAAGNDTNNGLTPTTAFATPQAAWNYIMARLDVGGQSVTVNMADGSYPPIVCNGSPVGAAEGSGVTFHGDTTSPSSVVIDNPNGIAAYVALGAIVSFSGMRFQAGGTGGDYNGNGCGLLANYGGYASFSNVDFGTCSTAQIVGQGGGSVTSAGAPYSISGNAPVHALAAYGGGGCGFTDSTITLYNTPTFSSAFVVAESSAVLGAWGAHFNGAAHGPRYLAQQNGIILCGVGNPDAYFPGDVNGSVATGGQIV